MPVPHAGDGPLQPRQPAVKEVPATGEHDHRELLRPRPREDIREGHDVVLQAELPGMSREDIEVTVEHQTLTIKGTRPAASDVPKDRYRRASRWCRP